ncbi:SDR family oxidoreductase [Nocardia nova]|uniref:SDR family oxidoreductase n=1 Tax=Nocardia nova TaxID=37330 RepID=UPI003406143A
MSDWFRSGLLAGKVALVTGGGTGIGLEIARGLGLAGARVVIASRSSDRLAQAASQLRALGVEAFWKQLDVRDRERVDAVVGDIVDELGVPDILVNNAGGTFPKRAEEISDNGWRTVTEITLHGTFYCTRAVGRRMIERGTGGKILNVTFSAERSTAGIAHMGAGRAAVNHLTRSLAVEWAQFGIQVNALGPQYLTSGAVDMYGEDVVNFLNGSTPAGRTATADEVAAWGVILSGPMSDYVTGAVIPLDGGNHVGAGIRFRGSPILPEPGSGASGR